MKALSGLSRLIFFRMFGLAKRYYALRFDLTLLLPAKTPEGVLHDA